MYDVLTGPVLWLVFLVCIGGCAFRVVQYVRGLNWQLDRVAYGAKPGQGFLWALKSIFHWLVPFGSRSWRVKPGFTITFFLFHIGLVIVPVFLMAHNVILKERFGFSLWTFGPTTADILTILAVIAAVGIVLRRIALPEVRIITTVKEYIALIISVAPLITGLLARFQVGDYDFWLITHIITGEIWLVAIPFTKLSHVVLFFCSRAQLGMDYGIKRGGDYGRGIAW